MTKEQAAEIIRLLTEIRDKLTIPASYNMLPVSSNNWRCAICGTWVLPGWTHACGGRSYTTGAAGSAR